MSRTSLSSQMCPCGEQARVSITIAATSLGEVPRRRSRAVTVYVCRKCERNPSRGARRTYLDAVLTAAQDLK